MKEIYLAGGCFWAVQKYFDLIFGVLETEVGYVNGRSVRTNYFRIPKTGHAEAVHIIYNPKVLPLEKLLNYYYEVIDPTSLNKQGNDAGKQYRTGIYYTDKSDVPLIIKSLEELQKKYTKKIVVEVEQLKNFVKAEGYHQDFLKNNPFGYCHIPIQKFEEVKAKQFDDMTYRVTKFKETEPAFDNEYVDNFEVGIYVDKETNKPLFSSKDKYDARCGWPTFYKSSFEDEIEKHIDLRNLMIRMEVMSKSGKNHLGHLFYDGPVNYGGKRFCINSAALRFIPKDKMVEEGFEEYLKYVD